MNPLIFSKLNIHFSFELTFLMTLKTLLYLVFESKLIFVIVVMLFSWGMDPHQVGF